MLVFVFSKVLDLGIENFPVFVFTGLIAWTGSRPASTAAATSVAREQRHLVFQPRCPTRVLPIVAVAVPLVDVLMALPVLLVMLATEGGLAPDGAAAARCCCSLQFALRRGSRGWSSAAAASSCATCRTSSVVLLTLPSTDARLLRPANVPEEYHWLLRLNPLTAFVETLPRRCCSDGQLPGARRRGVGIGAVAVAVAVGYVLFRRLEPRFVDAAVTALLRLEGVWKSYPRWTRRPRTLRGVLSRRLAAAARPRAALGAARRLVRAAPGEALGRDRPQRRRQVDAAAARLGLGRPTRGSVRVHPDTAAGARASAPRSTSSSTGRENALTAALVAG